MLFRDQYFNLNNTATLIVTIDEDQPSEKLSAQGVMMIDRPGDKKGDLLHNVLGVSHAHEVRSAINYLLQNRGTVSAKTNHGHTVRRGKPGPAKMFIHH